MSWQAFPFQLLAMPFMAGSPAIEERSRNSAVCFPRRVCNPTGGFPRRHSARPQTPANTSRAAFTLLPNVWVDFAEPTTPGVTQLSAGRRAAVVARDQAVGRMMFAVSISAGWRRI
jgi:hypothetical protein